jgi:hypothetical protein
MFSSTYEAFSFSGHPTIGLGPHLRPIKTERSTADLLT